MYKLFVSPSGNQFVINLNNGFYIPFVRGNTDYEEYLKWLAEGNEPLPADE